MKLEFELTDAQANRLQTLATRLRVPLHRLARAAVTDLVAELLISTQYLPGICTEN